MQFFQKSNMVDYNIYKLCTIMVLKTHFQLTYNYNTNQLIF